MRKNKTNLTLIHSIEQKIAQMTRAHALHEGSLSLMPGAWLSLTTHGSDR